MNKQDIEKSIESIAKRGKVLDQDIQKTGLACLSHVAEHGDITLLNRLYLALPRGARKSAFAAWVLAYGSAHANDDAATKQAEPFKYAKGKMTDLLAAAETSWFEFKPEPTPDELFDLTKAINAIIARAAKADKVSDPALLEKLKGMVVTA